MEEKRFSLSDPNTKCNITVGYISSERGFVDGVGLYEANHIAKLNPGTQFIFRNRDFVKYLNINEVNALTPEMMLPERRASAESCSGIVGLNLEGDTSKSIDVTLDAERPYTGGSTKDPKAVAEKDKTAVNFYGGGGVGVQAAPIIGNDGSILAVQVIHGGYGYKYAPIVDITDDTGKGGGVVARSIIKTRTSDEDVLIEEFDAEEDYEEYVLDKCVPEMENIGYGQRWGPDGKNLGKWDPSVYFNKSTDPIAYEIQRYQKYLLNLRDGIVIENNRIKGWWTTRQKAPLRVTSADKVTREKFDVQHPAWGGIASKSSNNNSNKTSSTFGVGTSLIESSFLVYTSGGQRRDLKFIFKSTSGNHSFEIKADDYKNNASAEEIKIKVKRNTKYNVTTTSRKGIRDKGLLKKGVFGTGGDIAQRTGTSNAIFSDIGKSAPDDDDLQVQCKQGTFSINGGNITYELKDSAAYNAEKNSMYGEGLKDNKKTDIQDSFMNQYAISPVPPSNVAGSDNAGKNYTFEWEEEFPYEGEYIFNAQCDNEARLFIDGEPVENFHIGAGGAAGHILSSPLKIKQYLLGGTHNIRLDLLNHQIREMKKIQKDVVATSDEVTFTVATASLFGNGIIIEGLDIDVSKEYGEGKDIKETYTRKVEYGRVYPVKLRSNNKLPATSIKGIEFSGLNAANNPINVTNNGTRLALKDGGGSDINASFTIENVVGGSAKFSADGKNIDATGDNVQVTLSLSWKDNPNIDGIAVQRIRIGDKTWTYRAETESSYKYIKPDGTLSITDGKQKPWIKSHQNDTNWPDENFTEFLRSYAVFPVHDNSLNDKLQTGIWNIDITTAGTYTLEVQSDDNGKVKWDDNLVGSVRWSDERTSTFTINNVLVGTHKLRGEITNNARFGNPWYDNPGGLAWTLKDPSGTIVATSLDPFNDTAYPLRVSGSETHTITLSGVNKSRMQLKTKGEKVLIMEDWTDESWDDLICSADNGRFFGISGSTCKFVVNPPEKLPGSTGSQKGSRAHVFNTVDWIMKANRKLWKMNPNAGKDCNFINQFGILPFDPTEVTKVEKKRTRNVELEPTGVPPSVKFEVGNDGKNYLKVIGNGRVKVGLEMNTNDGTGGRWGWAVREVKIQADDGEIVLKRTGRRYEKLSGTGTFSSGKKYLIKSLGGSKTSGSNIGVDKTLLQFDDAIQYGFDGAGSANVKITSVSPLPITKQIEETVFGYPDYPNASTDDYAGFHEIVWNNINFPEDGNYAVAVMVDDNVEIKFKRPNKKDIVINKKGFAFGQNEITYDSFGAAVEAVGKGKFRPTGKSVFIKYFEAGTYTLNAVLEQIPGGTITAGNVMGLAIDIKAAFISDEIEVISAKSWNENPMGVALTIDAPFAPIPKEPPQQQEGRCPNNPIWTTRSTNAVNEIWYPVNVNSWGKFMNRYSISPLPPLGLKGTDGAGTVYRNSWKVELPYRGFYGVKGTVDNFGKLFIDGVEVLGPNVDSKFDTSQTQAPKTKKILLEKKTVDITVEVENEKQFIWNTIDQKVFSTADWASKQNNTSTTIEGAKNVDVTFKVSSASLYANNIEMRGVFSVGKAYAGPNFNETYNRNIEVGRVYDVIFTSNNQAQKSTNIPIVYKGLNPANNPINVSNGGKTVKLKDGDGNDANATITIDKTDGGSVIFTDDGKGFKVTGGTAAKRVNTTITLSWNDRRRDGRAIDSFSVADKTWTRSGTSGTVTKSVYIYPPNADNNQNNNANIRLRNKGKGVVQMEDWTDNDWVDIMASATDGEFYNMVGNTCKYRIPSKDVTTIEYGKGLTGGSTKNGVSYSGPPLSTYVSGTLGPFLTPTFTTDEDYIANFNGKTWTMTWSNVDFPEDGTYDIQAEADDKLTIKLDGVEITTAEVGNGITKSQFNASKGKRTVELVLMNIDFRDTGTIGTFQFNPTVAAVKITKKVQVAKVDPRSGTALGKPWTVNPLGVSAILIPPPCPKKINGVGIVTAVIIDDPGNGFDPPIQPPDDDPPSGPSVIIEVDTIDAPDGGINYGPDDKVCIVNTETGEEVCYIPPKGPFGEILPFDPRITPTVTGGPPDPPVVGDPPPPTTPTVTITATPSIIPEGKCTELVYTSRVNTKLTIDQGVGDVPVVSRGTVKVCPTETTTYCITGDVGGTACAAVTVTKDPDDPLLDAPPDDGKQKPPNGYREYPQIIVRGRGTGIGYRGIPRMKAVLDPIGVDPKRLIQVTDLPGLKQTGYYDGKPYYGAIFYENGISYAGYYDTPGQKVQIYATLQESIDAQVTTPPSAIQRQGTDVNSNNPRLNIPGTPDNLT